MGEGKVAPIQPSGWIFLHVYTTKPHLLRKCDCMACISCVFWCVQLAKCHSSWEYKLGQHIKSSVSCWSSFFLGHCSLTELPSIAACLQWHMPNLPSIWKAFSMSLTPSQREASISPPPGYTACQKHKRRKLPLCCFRRCCFLILILCFFGDFFQKIDRHVVVFTLLAVCVQQQLDVQGRKTEARIAWA